MQTKLKILNFLRSNDPVQDMALEMKLNFIPDKCLERVSKEIDKDNARPREILKLLNQAFL
jgi:hypothetical protein